MIINCNKYYFKKIIVTLRQTDRETILAWIVVSPDQPCMSSKDTGMLSMGHPLFLCVHIAIKNVHQGTH